MATLEQAIASAIDELDRPDALTLARAKAIAALQICHGSHKFQKDITVTDDISIGTNSVTTIALPSRFRTYHALAAYGTEGDELQIEAKPKIIGRLTDEFGCIPLLQYLVAGGALTLYIGSGYPIDHCKMYYYQLPQVTTDAGTGEVSSDSWILTDYEQFFIDCLVWQVAKSLGLTDKVNSYLESFKFSLGQIVQANPVA